MSRVARLLVALFLVGMLTCIAGCGGSSQAKFPERPVELVVPYEAGGGTHLSAELLVPDAQKHLGQPLQIVTKPGGGGSVGTAYVAKAKADGYTLLFTTSAMLASPHIENVNYTKEDLVPIALATTTQQVIAVSTDSPWKTGKDLVEWVKANPGQFTWSHPGVGSSLHLIGAGVFDAMGIFDQVKDVPFKGTAPGLAAVMGGHVNAISCFASSVTEQVKAGKIRVIGVCGLERFPGLPDVPTFKEQGFDISLEGWRGVFAPKGIPKEVLAKLEQSFAKIIKEPGYADRATKLGEVVAYKDSASFAKMIESEDKVIGNLVKKIGLSKK